METMTAPIDSQSRTPDGNNECQNCSLLLGIIRALRASYLQDKKAVLWHVLISFPVDHRVASGIEDVVDFVRSRGEILSYAEPSPFPPGNAIGFVQMNEVDESTALQALLPVLQILKRWCGDAGIPTDSVLSQAGGVVWRLRNMKV